MRWLLVLLVACSSSTDRTGDPAVGRWTGDAHHIVELRVDGTLDMDPVTDRDCGNAPADVPALAACRARQRWSRTGTIVTLERGAFARPFDPTGFAPKRACECRLERVEVQLRGDELISGTEHAHRVH
jgi:hypothetical protein